MIRLFGKQAIEYKKQHLLCELNKFADSIGGEKYNISIKDAEDVREDLIYLDAWNEDYVHKFWYDWYNTKNIKG